MEKSVDEMLAASTAAVAQEQQGVAQEPSAARVKVDAATMYDIMGPRDTWMAWVKKTAISYLWTLGGTAVLVALGIANEKNGLGFVCWLGSLLGLLFVFVVTLEQLCRLGPSWKQRRHRKSLYDKVQRGEIKVDFHVPFKMLPYENYFFISSREGIVCFEGQELPLKDLYRTATREKSDGQVSHRYLLLHFRNLGEPIQAVWFKSNFQLEQQYERLINYLGWT